jgi:Zn finger protein HypA/HybF involved in hydrogenase expression
MPHRKIFKTLAGGIKDNKIAEYFHNSEGTLCQGCHHYSPVSKKPAACSSCHGEAFDARNPSKPGLMAAYHLQCMDCHQAMGLEKPVSTDCIACHKKK